ncbi:MAG: DUF5615 family PIN-like protein [Marinoscillum sp.]
MKFLANENVPITSVNYLKSMGFDITSIGVDDPGISDEHVMTLAIEQDRTIITYDSDYGELIFKHGTNRAQESFSLGNNHLNHLKLQRLLSD